MEQRRLRPGDRLDDYCPRERRLTDHVVVAVVDDLIKQTRCVACDAEHVYKDGKVPPRRKKKEDAPALVAPAAPPVVVEDVAPAPVPVAVPAPAPVRPPVAAAPLFDDDADDEPQPGPMPNLVMHPERKPARGRRGIPPTPVAAAPVAPPPVPDVPAGSPPPDADRVEDDGPVHRRLIRATLPRPEGQTPGRPLPEFTIRQPGTRGAGTANGFPRGGGQGQPRFGKGPRQGQGNGFGQGYGQSSWNGRSSGPGGHRPGASAHGQGQGAGQGQEPRGRHKSRSRNARKKGR